MVVSYVVCTFSDHLCSLSESLGGAFFLVNAIPLFVIFVMRRRFGGAAY
jgi:hypothetical protein